MNNTIASIIILVAAAAAAAAVICLSCIPEMKNSVSLYNTYTERSKYIEEQKSEGNLSPELAPIKSASRYAVFTLSGDISNDPELEWLNDNFIKYYNLDSVIVKD